MPNWVYNTVVITGDDKALEAIKELLATPHAMSGDEPTVFNFASLASIPEDKLDEYNTVHGYEHGKRVGETEFNWHVWNNKHWGTKWNAVEANLEQDDGFISYYFMTAWSLPEPIIERLADKCRELGLSFVWRGEEENGWGFEWEFDDELILTDEWQER
jgi:hypothetical protein